MNEEMGKQVDKFLSEDRDNNVLVDWEVLRISGASYDLLWISARTTREALRNALRDITSHPERIQGFDTFMSGLLGETPRFWGYALACPRVLIVREEAPRDVILHEIAHACLYEAGLSDHGEAAALAVERLLLDMNASFDALRRLTPNAPHVILKSPAPPRKRN